MLSETDKEALDFAVDNFKDVDDIVEETHKYLWFGDLKARI